MRIQNAFRDGEYRFEAFQDIVEIVSSMRGREAQDTSLVHLKDSVWSLRFLFWRFRNQNCMAECADKGK